MTYTVTQTITEARIADLLCAGFEGGIGYWATIQEYTAPKEPRRILGQRYTDYPLTGGAVLLLDAEEYSRDDDEGIPFDRDGDEMTPWVLDGAAIQRGLDLMAREYTQRWHNFVSENEDAEDGDVFIQLCLFGEVVYG